VRKGEFKKGDLCVYCEIDSILPEREEFEFLRSKKFRIKTQKIRGILSQGIAFPISVLNKGKSEVIVELVSSDDSKDPDPYIHVDDDSGHGSGSTFFLGDDVTAYLGVKKYEVPIQFKQGQSAGNFPAFIHKTDETRIQTCIECLEELHGKPYYITTKVDGTSGTFYRKDDHFGVCSRNFEKKEGQSVYWEVAKKYDLKSKLENYGKDVAIQGELAGPGIQKNRLGLESTSLFVFNIQDISKGCFLSFNEVKDLCNALGINMVPILEEGEHFNYTFEQLLELAEHKYLNGSHAEGIVIRPQVEEYSRTLHGRLSFKVINNKFLLKGGD